MNFKKNCLCALLLTCCPPVFCSQTLDLFSLHQLDELPRTTNFDGLKRRSEELKARIELIEKETKNGLTTLAEYFPDIAPVITSKAKLTNISEIVPADRIAVFNLFQTGIKQFLGAAKVLQNEYTDYCKLLNDKAKEIKTNLEAYIKYAPKNILKMYADIDNLEKDIINIRYLRDQKSAVPVWIINSINNYIKYVEPLKKNKTSKNGSSKKLKETKTSKPERTEISDVNTLTGTASQRLLPITFLLPLEGTDTVSPEGAINLNLKKQKEEYELYKILVWDFDLEYKKLNISKQSEQVEVSEEIERRCEVLKKTVQELKQTVKEPQIKSKQLADLSIKQFEGAKEIVRLLGQAENCLLKNDTFFKNYMNKIVVVQTEIDVARQKALEALEYAQKQVDLGLQAVQRYSGTPEEIQARLLDKIKELQQIVDGLKSPKKQLSSEQSTSISKPQNKSKTMSERKPNTSQMTNKKEKSITEKDVAQKKEEIQQAQTVIPKKNEPQQEELLHEKEELEKRLKELERENELQKRQIKQKSADFQRLQNENKALEKQAEAQKKKNDFQTRRIKELENKNKMLSKENNDLKDEKKQVELELNRQIAGLNTEKKQLENQKKQMKDKLSELIKRDKAIKSELDSLTSCCNSYKEGFEKYAILTSYLWQQLDDMQQSLWQQNSNNREEK